MLLGQIIIASDEIGLYHLQQENRNFIIDINGHVINCNQSDYHSLQNCIQLEDSLFTVDGCHLSIDMQSFEESLSRMENPFNFNSITKEKHFHKDPLYSNCNPEWNKVEIRNSLSSWMSSLSTFYFPFWFHNSSLEALDKLEPKIRITLPFFINRPGYLNNEVSIGTEKRVLLKGFLVNGTIEGYIKRLEATLFSLKKWLNFLKNSFLIID